MPTFTGTALNNLSYDDLVKWVNLSAGNNEYLQKYIAEAAKYGVDEMSAVEDMAATYMNFYKDGNGAYTITSFNSDAQISAINPVDSNIGTISRGNVQTPLNRAKDAITNKLQFSTTPASGSFAQNAAYFLGSVGQAVGCASVGITLGKTVEGALYNSNPDFWDSLGLWSINPETWKTLTNGDNSWQAGLFNFIYGIDPNTGNSQAYMNQEAFAYMAYALAQNGIFSSGGTITPPQEVPTFANRYVNEKMSKYYDEISTIDVSGMGTGIDLETGSITPRFITGGKVSICSVTTPVQSRNNMTLVAYSDEPFTATVTGSSGETSTITASSVTELDNNGNSYTYYYAGTFLSNRYYAFDSVNKDNFAGEHTDPFRDPSTAFALAYLFLNGEPAQSIDGIGTQDGATLPNISDWSDIPSTLSSLQNQYPDLWNNPLVWDNYQPDGTNPQKVYIPVATPNSTTGTNTQPTSSNSTQTNPQVSPATSTQSLLDFITNVMTQPNPQTNPQTQEETDTQPKIPPQNPVDVGTGTSSPIVPPVGSASALWSVYHPTQAQVNSFGAWLWGSPFLTDIGKLFQNPIDGVISLHKIYAPPVDSGSGTIVVGTLDSQVSSATVTQQYVTVDCGSIDCYEEFGNVFDYPPHTKVSLYLPFIGIVDLDTNDVMRSTVNITYGVDVFTGACLAMVEVTRDGNTVNLYQYAGVCAVSYPLGNVQQSQLFAGLLAVAGGVAASIASGGVAAPAALAVVGGVGAAAQSSIGRSGGFSGNAGAMGIKKPYLILQRPQTKVAETFPELAGYPTNYSCKLGDCSGHVVIKHAHIEGISATDTELEQIDSLLKDGVIV